MGAERSIWFLSSRKAAGIFQVCWPGEASLVDDLWVPAMPDGNPWCLRRLTALFSAPQVS